MPTYTIETPSGKRLDVQAPDESTAIQGARHWNFYDRYVSPSEGAPVSGIAEARKAGYSDDEILNHVKQSAKIQGADEALKAGYTPAEILSYLATGRVDPEQSTSFPDAVRQGTANVVGGLGETLKQYGPESAQGTAASLKGTAVTIAPDNYRPAEIVSKSGGVNVSPGNLARVVTEQAPGAALSVGAARLMPGPWWAKLLAGAGTYAATALGNRSKERAVSRTGDESAEPTTADKSVAAAAMLPESAIGAIGLSRFLPGAGAATSVGAKGLINAAGQLVKTAGIEAGTGTGQNIAAQVGRTVGTPGGVSVDPAEAVNAGLTQSVTGAALAGPRALKSTAGAVRYREFGGDNQQAAESVARRMQSSADGGDLSSPKVGFQALQESQRDVAREVRTAARSIDDTGMSPEAANAIARARASARLSRGDIEALEAAPSDARAPTAELASLARQALVLNRLQKSADYNTAAKTFTGGVARYLEKGAKVLRSGGIAGTAFGLVTNPAAMVHALPGVGGAIAAYGAARGLDSLTGARSPAKSFAEQFAASTPQSAAGDPLSGARALAALRSVNSDPERDTATPATVRVAQALSKLRSLSEGQGSTGNAKATHDAGHGVEEAPISDTLKHAKVNELDRTIARKAADEFATVHEGHPVVVERYRESTERKQARIRDRLMEAGADPAFPSSDLALMEALDKLRFVRTRDAVAAHVADVAAQHPRVAPVLHRYFGPRWARSVWNPLSRKKATSK
jgi:hypothetical protein